MVLLTYTDVVVLSFETKISFSVFWEIHTVKIKQSFKLRGLVLKKIKRGGDRIMKVKGYMENKFQDCLTAVSLSFVMFCFQRFM